jgi:hypothetical protein
MYLRTRLFFPGSPGLKEIGEIYYPDSFDVLNLLSFSPFQVLMRV